MRRLATITVTLSLALSLACSDSTGPAFPDVVGTYSGLWTIAFTVQATGEVLSGSCAGSLTIATQTDGAASGSFLMNQTADCDATSGTATGTVRTDGGVSLVLVTPGANASLEDVTGCAVVSEDASMSGTVAGNTMNISQGAILDCLGVGFDLDLSFAGNKPA